jgi:hypothetical protein
MEWRRLHAPLPGHRRRGPRAPDKTPRHRRRADCGRTSRPAGLPCSTSRPARADVRRWLRSARAKRARSPRAAACSAARYSKRCWRAPSAHPIQRELPDPGALLEECARLGLESIVCKRKDAPYRSGSRSGWIKVKTPEWKAANRYARSSSRNQRGAKGHNELLIQRFRRAQN